MWFSMRWLDSVEARLMCPDPLKVALDGRGQNTFLPWMWPSVQGLRMDVAKSATGMFDVVVKLMRPDLPHQ
jgi:hypothetical protein